MPRIPDAATKSGSRLAAAKGEFVVLKFNKSAKAAVAQIRAKGYADAFKGDRRPVTLVGVNFRSAKRNIDEPLFAPL